MQKFNIKTYKKIFKLNKDIKMKNFIVIFLFLLILIKGQIFLSDGREEEKE